jgi:hypothetical protein
MTLANGQGTGYEGFIMKCPLCHGESLEPVEGVPESHAHCLLCDLRFLRPELRLEPAAEKQRYMTHNNDVNDPGYRDFLEPLAKAVQKRVMAGGAGLEFGCGPGPALAARLGEHNYSVTLFDPFFHPDPSALANRYDFITASEVAEHLYFPAEEFARLAGLLKPGGWLGLMTWIYEPEIDFANWIYRKDPTHVAFYSQRTFTWIAGRFGFQSPEFEGPRVVCLHTKNDI